MKRAAAILSLCCLALTGCQVLSYHGPNGERFSRWSFGNRTALTALTVDVGSNGLRRVTLKGYTNDQVESIGAITEAAVSAAIKGVKP